MCFFRLFIENQSNIAIFFACDSSRWYFLHYCFTLVTWGNSKSILILDFFKCVLYFSIGLVFCCFGHKSQTNKQTKVYFHKLSRQTPPPQVVYKPWLIITIITNDHLIYRLSPHHHQWWYTSITSLEKVCNAAVTNTCPANPPPPHDKVSWF